MVQKKYLAVLTADQIDVLYREVYDIIQKRIEGRDMLSQQSQTQILKKILSLLKEAPEVPIRKDGTKITIYSTTDEDRDYPTEPIPKEDQD